MANFRYLGLDETRNGRTDVLFVGVASSNNADIQKSENLRKLDFNGLSRKSGKKKKKGAKPASPEVYLSKIFDIIDEKADESPQNRDFRYVLIPEYFSSHFHKQQIKIIGFAALINAFGELEKVIIDGNMRGKSRETLKGRAGPVPIMASAEADVTYPIVNMADQIANILYRLYSDSKKNGVIMSRSQDRLLGSRLIEPRLSDYKGLIKR